MFLLKIWLCHKESNDQNFQSHKNLKNGMIADWINLILRWIMPLIKLSIPVKIFLNFFDVAK